MVKNNICILVWRAITILKNMSSSMGRMTSHMLWKIKNVPNHQPVYIYICTYTSYIYLYIYIILDIVRDKRMYNVGNSDDIMVIIHGDSVII
jgi:hypothetical protein